MTRDDFIKALKIRTSDSATTGVLSDLHQPAGRAPSPHLLKLSNWYGTLSSEDQTMLRAVVEEAAQSAVFGFLCVLDGVRSIEPQGPKGDLHLTYSKNGDVVLLNDPNQEPLHDSYNALRNREL